MASQGTQDFTNSTLGIGTVRRQKTSHTRNGGTILKPKDTERERKTINKNNVFLNRNEKLRLRYKSEIISTFSSTQLSLDLWWYVISKFQLNYFYMF